ncbi:MAG: hypothetical protein CSB01_00345 [Bacteroidia bacterium]|nr:MAG: hypothetical protein CSB01_00345 [Bacteroidia bacterium]
MKKLIYYILGFTALLFAACDLMDDIYTEMDENKKPINYSFDYELTDDDYASISKKALKVAKTSQDSAKAKAIKTHKTFSESIAAADYIGYALVGNFPALGKNSAINVTYNYALAEKTYLAKLSSATEYTVSKEDYDAMGEDGPGKYDNFSSSVLPDDYLPGFLADKFPNEAEGAVYQVFYKYYSGKTEDRFSYYYLKNSKWMPVPNPYILEADDYDAMGKPGKYDNFSSSIDPDDYLPTFLGIKFPYAQAGDQKLIIYAYYAGGGVTEMHGKEYEFDGTNWKIPAKVIKKTSQFIHTGSTWVFDPTVRFTMGTEDYQMIVDWVATTEHADLVSSYGNNEYYTGASAHYNNFDARIYKYTSQPEFAGLSDEDAAKLIQERIIIGITQLLKAKYPNAVAQVSGIDVMFIVTYLVYDGSNHNYTIKLQCTKSAPNPEFEVVEGPTEF